MSDPLYFNAAMTIVTRDGRATPEFAKYIAQHISRSGGVMSLSNAELDAAIARVIAGEMTLQPSTQTPLLDVLLQPSQSASDAPDLMQPVGCDCVQDMILQG